jgi:hypothetical protein
METMHMAISSQQALYKQEKENSSLCCFAANPDKTMNNFKPSDLDNQTLIFRPMEGKCCLGGTIR